MTSEAGELNVPDLDTKSCDFCAETIKKDAVVCRFCGKDLKNAVAVISSNRPALNSNDGVAVLKSMSPEEMAIYNSELTTASKSVATAYLIWFFLGWFGVHKYYLGSPGSGTLYLVLTLFGLLTCLLLIGLLPLSLVGLGWLVDAFTLTGQVDEANIKVKKQILCKIRGTA